MRKVGKKTEIFIMDENTVVDRGVDLYDATLVKQLTPEDIGKWFTYVDGGGNAVLGKLKSFNNKMGVAWIVYNTGGNWDADHWKDYTAAATKYSDIKELQTNS